MNTARYVLALVVVLAYPPGLLLWLAIHPFARFWRRLGPVWTYSILGVPTLGYMAGMFLSRAWILAVDFGTSYPLMGLAVLVLAAAVRMTVQRKKHLTFGILSGLPELSERRYPGQLLTEGLYARIRHPRYVEAFLWTLAYALFANYLAPYLVMVAALPVIYLIVILEERELCHRFGEEYIEYCRRVPRFVPRRA
jgi:protein-S-isoprenylcysteine O-methyltransferase Ste14